MKFDVTVYQIMFQVFILYQKRRKLTKYSLLLWSPRLKLPCFQKQCSLFTIVVFHKSIIDPSLKQSQPLLQIRSVVR